jgi:hypothetical protein
MTSGAEILWNIRRTVMHDRANGAQPSCGAKPSSVSNSQGLRMKDAGEDLFHISVVSRGHFCGASSNWFLTRYDGRRD